MKIINLGNNGKLYIICVTAAYQKKKTHHYKHKLLNTLKFYSLFQFNFNFLLYIFISSKAIILKEKHYSG